MVDSATEPLWAAGQDLRMDYTGVVKVRVQWRDDHWRVRNVKLWACVVPDLIHSLILPNDFTLNHPEVWRVAVTIDPKEAVISVLRFGKIRKSDRSREQDFQNDSSSNNQAQDQQMVMAERNELARRLGILRDPGSSPGVSNNTGTSTSETSTNQSTQDKNRST